MRRRGREPRRHRLDAEPAAPAAARSRGATAAGQPAVDLLVSTDTVRVGEQVDVVTAAWFPRDLRLQLRRPPTLQPPVIDGVWSFPQTTPDRHRRHPQHPRPLVRSVRLAPGRLPAGAPGRSNVPRATLKYSTPVALQFFSQEERFALSSRAETLIVRPLPDAGRPAGLRGRDRLGALARAARRSRRPASVGEGLAVELRVTGEGNTALWPNPDVALARGGARLSRAGRRAGHGRPMGAGRRHQDLPLSRGPRFGGRAGAAARALRLLRSRGRPIPAS